MLKIKNFLYCLFQILANLFIFVCGNLAGVFTHYPTEAAQRQAFLETRRCIEARLTTQRENQEQVQTILFLLMSGFFIVLANLSLYCPRLSVGGCLVDPRSCWWTSLFIFLPALSPFFSKWCLEVPRSCIRVLWSSLFIVPQAWFSHCSRSSQSDVLMFTDLVSGLVTESFHCCPCIVLVQSPVISRWLSWCSQISHPGWWPSLFIVLPVLSLGDCLDVPRGQFHRAA